MGSLSDGTERSLAEARSVGRDIVVLARHFRKNLLLGWRSHRTAASNTNKENGGIRSLR